MLAIMPLIIASLTLHGGNQCRLTFLFMQRGSTLCQWTCWLQLL